MADYQLVINGALTDAAAGETFATYNPARGEKLADVAKAGKEDAVRAIEAARKAFDDGPWSKTTGKERAEVLRKISQLITDHAAELSEIEALDGGGTIRKAQLADIPGGSGAFDWFAKMAEERDSRVDLPGSPFPVSSNYVLYEPLGVCTGIVPWNFPFLMACWKIAPALAAGNTSVIKPATYTSLTALKLGQLILEADLLPPGVLNVLAGPGGTVGEELASNPLVDKVAFTGSTEVGRRIMQLASGTLKPVTLELGGKSANIVLDDADLDQAAAAVLWGTFLHNGQVCESGTRALVQKNVYDEFVSLLADRAGKIVLGDQMDMGTDQGPMVDKSQVETVERYVAIGRAENSEPITGGAKPEGLPEGLDIDMYFQPTIFADVDNTMTIAQEEIFGPVLSVIPYDDVDDAVRIANDSDYGLSGSVWTGDPQSGVDVARRVRTGTYGVNGMGMDFSSPFGGFKDSGLGRELGPEGLAEYLESKTIVLPQGFEPS